jgi:hypothetical protein
MPSSTSTAFSSMPRIRAATLNFFAPVLLAWVLTHALYAHLHPAPATADVQRHAGFGQVTLRLKLPGTSAGIPEPLISCGNVGEASLVFIRLLPKGRAKVGVEFWGLEMDQGPEFELPSADAEIVVTCTLPAFYPQEGDGAWGRVPPEIRKRRSSEFSIAVDGVVRLKGSVDYREPKHSPIYFGANPLGGSFVSDKFTGTILQIAQGF